MKKQIPSIQIPSNKPNNRILTALLASLALASSVASAALTAYDGFDYGGTGGDLTGENGGTGWGGAYTDSGNSTIYSTTGLNYTGLATTGGASNTNDNPLFPLPDRLRSVFSAIGEKANS